MTILMPPAHEPLVRHSPAATYSPGVVEHWSPATVIAFRFCLIYFGLYVLTTQMLSGYIPLPIEVPPLAEHGPFKAMVVFIGTHLLRLKAIPYQPTGSGDTLHDWVHAFSLLLIASIATGIWSMISRPQHSHTRMYAWFRLFLRIGLGTTMLGYGLIKVIPMQMPTLALTRLVEPFGNFSPMGVLWYSIGASPAYEIATGCAETLTGILLLIPATASLGATLGLFCITQVFLLNMTYDVPVKLFSFNLILMVLFLLAPNATRLWDIFILHRPAATAPEPRLLESARGQRAMIIGQIVFAVIAVSITLYGNIRSWKTFGGGAPRSALFGVWRVDEMSVDGVVRPPLLTDSTRWRHVIFQSAAGAAFQRMDDSFRRYGATIDTLSKTLKLTAGADTSKQSILTYSRPASDELILDGSMDGHRVHLDLSLRELNSFLIRSRGFNWIQELPFNR